MERPTPELLQKQAPKRPGGDDDAVREIVVTVDGRPARAFVGGSGVPLVLVHGGWGGASSHWRSVWARLAERYRVVAPDLPGVGDTAQAGLGSVGAYSRWLAALLDELGVESAWCAGNSFGATVVSRFAIDFPARCRGLVFVNGFPLPRTPRALRWLGRRRLPRRLVQAIEKQVAYRPAAMSRGFVDPANVPPEFRALVRQKDPAQVPALTDVLIEGGGTKAALPVAPLLLWGEEDRLPGTTKESARKLAASLPGSRLVFVPRAGHMPQVERSEAFVEALVSFIEAKESARR